MMLFIDKIVARFPKGLCLLIGIACVVLSIISMPYTPQMKCIEGIISKYKEDVRHVHHVKGADHDIEFYYIIIEDTRVDIALHEEGKFKGKERYWKEKLEGKHAKVCYLQKYRQIIHDIELEDGSYSYHNPRDISSYGVGWFPFCIFAPIALFCIFVLLRYFYLQTFASDERRILVFGNKDGDL
ncbi:MAG: hypothetical protein K6G73_05985 [Marinilabiliaceae bacterium]|nr:hypothetical protein [Marinilabiliaceae bacterium]